MPNYYERVFGINMKTGMSEITASNFFKKSHSCYFLHNDTIFRASMYEDCTYRDDWYNCIVTITFALYDNHPKVYYFFEEFDNKNLLDSIERYKKEDFGNASEQEKRKEVPKIRTSDIIKFMKHFRSVGGY